VIEQLAKNFFLLLDADSCFIFFAFPSMANLSLFTNSRPSADIAPVKTYPVNSCSCRAKTVGLGTIAASDDCLLTASISGSDA